MSAPLYLKDAARHRLPARCHNGLMLAVQGVMGDGVEPTMVECMNIP